MIRWSWKEGLVFAFAKKFLPVEGTEALKMNLSEKLGSQLLKPLYRMIEFISKNIRIPLAICLFTLLATLIIGFIFYNIPILFIIGELFPLGLVRFLFFIYVELNLFAMGCMAFGRFNNKALVEHWKRGQLNAVLLGDHEVKM